MKKMNMILRKCKSLSRNLGRSSSYSSLRSKSTRDNFHYIQNRDRKQVEEDEEEENPVHVDRVQEGQEIILVGSTRKPYRVNSEHLNHPILKSLMEKEDVESENDAVVVKVVKCEVVLFDHLLWMLENADPNFVSDSSLEELANLYVY